MVKQEQSFENSLMELENMQKMADKLFKMKHYQKLGDVGIFTIIQKAKSVGLNPLDALNGGMYFVNGKVELSSNTMNYLIRQSGHSITKDKSSTKDCCVLVGKRKDNGDTFSCSFSIEDAKKAGILKNVWLSYPEDMLFARALSRLARQLFPDVCKGCYTEGEIPKDDEKQNKRLQDAEFEELKETAQIEYIAPIEYITKEQQDEIQNLINQCDPKLKANYDSYIDKKCNGGDLSKLPAKCYNHMVQLFTDRRAQYLAQQIEAKMNGNDEVKDATE